MDQIVAFLESAPLWAVWLLFGVVALLLARKTQIQEWAESHPRVAGVLKLMRSVGLDPWTFLDGVFLILLGRLPARPEFGVKPRRPSSGGGLGVGLFMVALVLSGGALGSVTLSACSATQTHAARVEAQALGFNAAAVALVYLDRANADYIDSLENPTEDQILAGRARLQHLLLIRDTLKQVRGWVAGENDADGPTLVAETLKLLRGVAASLKAEGVVLPAEVDRLLDLGEYL